MVGIHTFRSVLVSSLTVLLLVTAALAGGTATADASDDPDAGFVNVGDPDVTVWFESDVLGGGPTIQDASGCNDAVCIYLKGSGTYLSEWKTTATVSGSTCSYARFHRNGSVIRTSSTICSSGSGTLVAIWDSPGYFSDGDKLCNSWYGISGYPCKYIQA